MIDAIMFIVAVLVLCVAALIATRGEAQGVVVWDGFEERPPSSLTLDRHPDDPATWVLRFENELQHARSEYVEMDLDGDILKITILYGATISGAERIVVEPPPGWESDRLAMTVEEYQSDEIHLWRNPGEIM